MKKISTLLIILLLSASTFTGHAKDIIMNKCFLYVNDTFVESEDNVQLRKSMLLPLRTVFEALGATVNWQEETGETIIQYRGESYLCYIYEPNPGYPKYFYIKKKDKDEFIYLTPMSMGGLYYIINDRIYLAEESGRRLFEAVGCSVEIDEETHTVKIRQEDDPVDTYPHIGPGR